MGTGLEEENEEMFLTKIGQGWRARCGKSFTDATQEAASSSRVSLTTFSIAAYCPRTGELGIVVSTAIPAVGAINPFAKARVGAIATQAWSNPYLGIDGLNLLEHGLSLQRRSRFSPSVIITFQSDVRRERPSFP